jgi:hypothetical protein
MPAGGNQPPRRSFFAGRQLTACAGRRSRYSALMFTIEHEFDATVVTLVDEGPAPLIEDITINAFEDCITVEQFDPRSDQVVKITLSLSQLRDLEAALDLPEGVYRLRPAGAEDEAG